MRRAAKVDANQSEIVFALRSIGVKGELCGGVCPVCSTPLKFGDKGVAQKYCSRQCIGKAVGRNGSARIRGALREATCYYCKEKFSSYYDNRKYCSRTCAGLQRSLDGTTKMRRFSSRVDDNQSEIMEALRKVGASVLDCSSLGKGFPDLIVGFRGRDQSLDGNQESK